MTTSAPANASSPANISPVGPPPAITTACSVITGPPIPRLLTPSVPAVIGSANRVMVSTFGWLAASPLSRVTLKMAAEVRARRARRLPTGLHASRPDQVAFNLDRALDAQH